MNLETKDLQYILDAGKEAAYAALELLQNVYLNRYTYNKNDLSVKIKTSDTDLVTKYDVMAEQLIISILNEKTPQCKVISEETNSKKVLTDEPTWVIDPIDGTMAFVHGSFDCCVGIGLAIDKKPVIGIIACPFVGSTKQGEVIYGGKGLGTYCNGKKVPKFQELFKDNLRMSDCIVSMNTPYRVSKVAVDASLNIRGELARVKHIRGLRSFGSCLFTQAQLVLGRVGVCMEVAGQMWDCCAGVPLIEELGGTVLSADGKKFSLEDHTYCCGVTKQLALEMAELCNKYDYKNAYWK